jgi:hypothetical protein
MSDTSLNAGKYQGSGLGDFDVKTNKNSLKGQQAASEAMKAAKNNPGAELEVINSSGEAGVYPLTIKAGTFTKPKATASGLITIDNLSSSIAPDDKKKLAIDPNIAGKLGGSVAVLVDEKNNTKVIGGEKFPTANGFIDNNPNAKKLDAAYTIAGDDNYVNKRLAGNNLNQLSANYRDTGTATAQVSLLKEGQVKSAMNSLIGQLNELSASTGNVETQRRARDSKYNSEIAQPQNNLNTANQNWNNANKRETEKVQGASENLREAKYPGVHETESSLENAKGMVSDGKTYLSNAANKVTNARNEVNRLETLKDNTTALSVTTQNLEKENTSLNFGFATYLVGRKDQLLNIKANLIDKANYYQVLADKEDRKPNAPAPSTNTSSGGSMTLDKAREIANRIAGNGGMVSKDELKENGYAYLMEQGPKREAVAGSDNQISAEEFAQALYQGVIKPSGGDGNPGGSGSGNDIYSDPFGNKGGSGSTSGAGYRNGDLVKDYMKKASETKADANYADLRIQALDRVISAARRSPDGLDSQYVKSAINSMSDYTFSSYSYIYNSNDAAYVYFTGENSDKTVIDNKYLKPFEYNKKTIYNNNNIIRSNVAEYRNNIDGANNNLQKAESSKVQAEGNLSGAQSTVTQLSAELERINNRAPVADSNPAVKPVKAAYDKAVKNMDNTVGENAPLTKEKVKTQGIVDGINNSYSTDVNDLNRKISDNAGQAQNLINTTKRNIGL